MEGDVPMASAKNTNAKAYTWAWEARPRLGKNRSNSTRPPPTSTPRNASLKAMVATSVRQTLAIWRTSSSSPALSAIRPSASVLNIRISLTTPSCSRFETEGPSNAPPTI